MPLLPPYAAFTRALTAELAEAVTSALTAEREEQTVCALALATLVARYPGHEVTVRPSRGRPFIGMIDVVIAPPPDASPPLHVHVRLIVNDELARGAWRAALTTIVDASIAAVTDARRANPTHHT